MQTIVAYSEARAGWWVVDEVAHLLEIEERARVDEELLGRVDCPARIVMGGTGS